MIKLVASDIDGTLIQDNSQKLRPEIFPIIRSLKKLGILFVAASGRQYPNLRRLFAPVQDEIAYICENGCLLKYKGETLYKADMPDALAGDILHKIWEKEGAEVLLSGEDTSYICPKSESFLHLLRDIVKNNVTEVEDIFRLREPAFKISVYEEKGIDSGREDWQKAFAGKVTAVTSGYEWLDFTPLGAHKGTALEKLQKRLGIKPEESMAFGDEYNDIEMLQNVGYSYAMESAKTGVLAVSRCRTARVEPILEQLIKQKGAWGE